MLQSIFTRPLFINPQAYLVIPELASIHNYTPYDFDSTEYSFKVITSGKIEGKLLKAKDDYILHLDLYSIDGNCVLGEFYLNNSQIDQNSFNLQQNGNIVTINFSSIPSPIASYRCYDKTNDDSDRDVLTDLTGNGHDITLHNFAFDGASGYGKYSIDMNSIIYKESDKSYRLNYNTFNLKGVEYPVIRFPVTSKDINFTINVSIKNEYTTSLLDVYYTITGKPTTFLKRSLENGISNISYVIPEEDEPTNILIAWRDNTTNVDIDIEFIPDYKGALVSDGVDDYGLCKNFPILTKENGYTVFIIRKIFNSIDVNSCLIIQGNYNDWSFVINLFYQGYNYVRNWGNNITIGKTVPTDLFVYQNSKTYNGIKDLTIGDKEGLSQNLSLFSMDNTYLPISAALYALEIYDRDLTDEEIAKVKARMIAEYEEKTGNKYEEEETI